MVSEKSFLRNQRPFEKKEKKIEKKIQKFQSGIFGLFLTVMASKLSGIDSTQSEWVSHAQLDPEGCQSKIWFR